MEDNRMRVRALAFRILNQLLRHDRRTLALMLVAPVFLLTLVYFILGDTVPLVKVAVINAPAGFEDKLEEQNIRSLRYSESDARLALEQAKNSALFSRPDLKSEVNYVYGQEDLSTFDNFGATLIGFIIFFFVFLVSGISFLQERTSGTLEKLLSTPVRRWEIVVGYVLGFGLFTVLQSFLISWYCVYVLKVMMIDFFA